MTILKNIIFNGLLAGLILKTVIAVQYGVYHENDIAKLIFTHSPSMEMTWSSLHPEANLYTRPMSNEMAKKQHKTMREAVKMFGVKVYTVKEALLENTNSSDGKEMQELREFGSKYLTYDVSHLEPELEELRQYASNLTEDRRKQFTKKLNEIEPQLRREYQEKYRQEVLKSLPPETLLDVILERPTVELHLRHWTIDNEEFVNLECNTIEHPLGNLYFMRDQQITTQKGIVMLRSRLRAGEAEVTEFMWKKFGIPITCRVTKGFAEGGEYIPAGDLVFFGQGVRTSMSAIEELLENDCFGANEVAVVRDYKDFSNDRMHLDTFFNILDGQGGVLMLQDILSKHKRFVDLYSKKSGPETKSLNSTRLGPYALVGRRIKFGQFLKNRGFKVTTVTNEEQQKFALNFLNIGNSTIVTSYGEPSYLNKLKELGVSAQTVDVNSLLEGNGGVHCVTQVVHRERIIQE